MIQNGIEHVPKIDLEIDFWTHRGPKFNEKHIFLSKTTLSKLIYSKPFWQTHHELTYRVYLKHRNSILKKTCAQEKQFVGRK